MNNQAGGRRAVYKNGFRNELEYRFALLDFGLRITDLLIRRRTLNPKSKLYEKLKYDDFFKVTMRKTT
jgi:hypothetical protein